MNCNSNTPRRSTRGRYTLAGDAEAEARIEADLTQLAREVPAAVGPDARALLLLGSYARGEGGVEGTPPRAHNDYDLVLITRGSVAEARARIASARPAWVQRAKVDVDIWVLPDEHLQSPPRTLFWFDAQLGGVRLLAGDPSVLDTLTPPRPRALPLGETGRLLANRAVGLALSNLEGPGVHRDRAARHVHKAVLACGDARLIAIGSYESSVVGRAATLTALRRAPADGDELVEAYADAVHFRARPDHWRPSAGSSFLDWYRHRLRQIERWHLSFEAWRVGAPLDPVAYASFRRPLYPRLEDVRAPRAMLSALLPTAPVLGHPREHLARAAVALAYRPSDVRARAAGARRLGMSASVLGKTIPNEPLHRALTSLSTRGG